MKRKIIYWVLKIFPTCKSDNGTHFIYNKVFVNKINTKIHPIEIQISRKTSFGSETVNIIISYFPKKYFVQRIYKILKP